MKPIAAVLKEIGWDDKLRELARRVRSNVPARSDPERFHVEKDEIVKELERMSRGNR